MTDNSNAAPVDEFFHENKEEPQKPETESKAVAKHSIPVEHGVALPRDIDGQYRLAALYYKSKMLPARFTSPEQVLTAMHFALEHFAHTPLTALRQIAVIEGTPCMFGDLPLAKVLQSGKMESKKEYFVDTKWLPITPENKNMGADAHAAVCETWRVVPGKDSIHHVTSFSVDDAKKADLWGKKVWAKYPKDMLRYKARGRNLKDQFADALNGVAQGEFDHDMTIETVEAKMVGGGGLADEINTKLIGEPK